MSSPHVAIIAERIKKIHEQKNADYAQESNPFSNFERMGLVASWFNDPTHKAFANMIGVKLARLAELLNGKSPKNESIDDSFLDLCTYCVLFHAQYLTSLEYQNQGIVREKMLDLQNAYKMASAGLQELP